MVEPPPPPASRSTRASLPRSLPSNPPHLTTILAHIDHGKTTLSDCLLSQLGSALSHRSLGARLLDSLDEERERGITIRSGGALLHYEPQYLPITSLQSTGQWTHHNPPLQPCDLQIFDSPGHLDFSDEVTSCVSITPTAVLLVDVLEGPGIRTVQIVRECLAAYYDDNRTVRPVVVLNKIDRLFEGDAGEPPTVSEVQALEARLRSVLTTLTSLAQAVIASHPTPAPQLVDLWTFTPSTPHVVYAAAKLGFGVTGLHCCRLFAGLHNREAGADGKENKILPKAILANLDSEVKGRTEHSPYKLRLVKTDAGPEADEMEPLPMWTPGMTAFASTVCHLLLSIRHLSTLPDPAAAVSKTKLFPPSHISLLNARELKSSPFSTIMRTLFPASLAVLVSVSSLSPAPPPSSPFLVITKFLPASPQALVPLPQSPPLPPDDLHVMAIGLAHCDLSKGFIDGKPVDLRFFVMQGSGYIEVDGAKRGCVVAVLGLEGRGRCVVAATEDALVPDSMKPKARPGRPVVKVVVEAESVGDQPKVEAGLRRLGAADETVEVTVTAKGELVLAAMGEVHAEVVLRDLKDVYCGGVAMRTRDLGVEYRETVIAWDEEKGVWGSEDARGWCKGKKQQTAHQLQLPEYGEMEGAVCAKNGTCALVFADCTVDVSILPLEGRTAKDVEEVFEVLDTFGTGDGEWDCYAVCRKDQGVEVTGDLNWVDLVGSCVAGFNMFVRHGPICEEAVGGVVCVFEVFDVGDAGIAERTGAIVGAVNAALRAAMITRPCRLLESFVKCDFQATVGSLGKVYGVLNKRRGKVLDEGNVEGTELLVVECAVPLAETKGISVELLEKTSGDATSPMMAFSHWEVIDDDPFWRPSTEEEREDFGEGLKRGDVSFGGKWIATRAVQDVRRRKGLLTEEKLVVAADKQRNLTRNK